jgi:hypothetical protein
VSVRFGSSQPSDARLAVGILVLLGAVATALVGLTRLGAAIDLGQAGAPIVRGALVILGVAGGGVAVGICLLIWEFTARLARRTGKYRIQR